MSFADSFFVAHLGIAAVAAVGVSHALLQVFFAVFLAAPTRPGWARRRCGSPRSPSGWYRSCWRNLCSPCWGPRLRRAVGSILRGAGDTWAVLSAGVWMNAVHLVLTALLWERMVKLADPALPNASRCAWGKSCTSG
ncbi:hypothetical protein [Deinococcus carri]|uniref:hypothetical protein n=1 Tax=Deinococcus carri TaxID=1211323 RepID=UPI0031ED5AFD